MPRTTASRTGKPSTEGRVTVRNVNLPGHTRTVDAAKYQAMRRVMLKLLPPRPPGLTYTEIQKAVVARLPGGLFPGGAKAGWWTKVVQLDLEAKGLVRRERTRPLRLYLG